MQNTKPNLANLMILLYLKYTALLRIINFFQITSSYVKTIINRALKLNKLD